ncbi:phosphotransferase enzyme family protein [Marinobacter nauticus]|uniref:phosphotransferase enzyme family protein n=1 Tax=Marinobacter nauticus TaxID=2743 RepID=UPI00241E0440|nr:aminoglycoside phosphotransferase family protein [Marinobacter nauticus]
MPLKKAVAARFFRDGRIKSLKRLGNGLVNDTFLVEPTSWDSPRFVLQRINREVFPSPLDIMSNLEVLSRHLETTSEAGVEAETLEKRGVPALYRTADGKTFHVDDSGHYWRALTYVEDSMTLDRLESVADAEQVGLALGHFHSRVSDLEPGLMRDTLPGFHVTPEYLCRYDRIVTSSSPDRFSLASADVRFCRDYIESCRAGAAVLEKARGDGLLAERVIHGDPKLNNILFHRKDRKALAMIDLDTVKPGLVHYDIGDCLRSCCNNAGESGLGSSGVRFDLDIAEAILTRYFEKFRSCLGESEIDYLYDAIYLLPFELGLRFFSDYLQDNRYFKVQSPDQNLAKAVVQFNLAMSVGKQKKSIHRLIRKLTDPVS